MVQLIYMGISALRSGFLLYLLLQWLHGTDVRDRKAILRPPAGAAHSHS